MINFLLHGLDPVQQMMDGVYSFHIDGQVVVHTGVSFNVVQLGCRQVAFSFYGVNLYQSALFQHVKE